jgi:periplasmic protein TonB
MYHTTQQSSPTTRATGAAIAVLVTAVVGYALATGIAHDIVKRVETITTMTLIQRQVDSPEPVVEEQPAVETVETLPLPDLIVPEEVFALPEEPVMIAEPAPVLPAIEPAPTGAPSGSGRTSPRLRPGNEPVYPSASVRAQEQGTTELQVCVSAQGRVTQANVVKSSGFPRLDEAAAKWVQSARFTPGAIGGLAQSMCGHTVAYEWSLKDA